jgi:hypothetical protein
MNRSRPAGNSASPSRISAPCWRAVGDRHCGGQRIAVVTQAGHRRVEDLLPGRGPALGVGATAALHFGELKLLHRCLVAAASGPFVKSVCLDTRRPL